MGKADRTKLKVVYKGKDISKEIQEYILDFSYTDNDNDAEDLQLTLENKEELWYKEWFPEKGDTINATIIMIRDGATIPVPIGKFEVDSINVKGKPNITTIKAITAFISGEIRDTKRSKAWEKIKFKAIVSEIAGKHGYSAVFNIQKDKLYDKVDQNNLSDIEFIKKLCKDLGYDVKVNNTKIIITDEEYYESKGPDFNIYNHREDADKSDIFDLLNWEFDESSIGAYTSCENQYKDPKTRTVYKAKAESKKEKKSKKVLRLNKKVKSDAENEQLCKDALKRENAKTKTAKFSFAPDKAVYGKNIINVSGWGVFDGKYLIDSVTHKIDSNGYTVDLDCRKFYKGMSITTSSSTSTESDSSKGSDKVEAMISHAESMIGMGYSQPMRMSAKYADCSSTVCRSMSAAGLMPEGAAYDTSSLPDCGYLKEVPMSDLQRGDVLNYRRGGKGHAMIYIGDGKVIEAQPRKGVVVGKLRTKGYKAYRPTGG